MRRIAIIGLACLAAGCSGELTELLVVVDSDLAVPSELDAVQVTVSGVESMSASGAITNAEPLPRTVGVVHRGGGLGPVEVTVIGSRGGTEVIRARAVTWFVRGRTLVLPIFLSQECTGVTCPTGRTCSGGACVSASVDPATLAVWNGTVPRLDGGEPMDGAPPPDGGPVCIPTTERCNGADDDCDDGVDEGFDLATDPLNCGGCGDVCMLAGATEGCAGGVCTIASCDADRGDCNGDERDGCEADLASSALHCGACDDPCDPANATGTCADGVCGIDTCDAGFGDCNADASDGCELALDTLTDCGACGMACTVTGGTPTCATGTCAIETCDDPLLGDCNADASDGCELTLDTLTDCGGCGMTCDLPGASETCATGTCEVVTCDAGFDDCDGDPANGCETALNTLTDCGACGTVCNITGQPETCATGTCLVACSSGRGDCDTSRSNGCEVNLRTSETHCGMCGNACGPGDNCNSGVCS